MASGERLFSAAFCGKEQRLRRLLEGGEGAEWARLIDWTGEQGVTPLHAACQQGHAACARLLVERRANVNSVGEEGGETPLLTACRFGRHECALLLLRGGADLRRRGANGESALHEACRVGSGECVSALLDAGAEIEATDSQGEPPHASPQISAISRSSHPPLMTFTMN